MTGNLLLFGVDLYHLDQLRGRCNQTREIVYANGIKTAFSYSPPWRWLTRVRTTTSARCSWTDHTRDGAGRITAIDGAPSTKRCGGTADDWTYTYQSDSPLTATNAASTSLSETFTYDTNGNMLSRPSSQKPGIVRRVGQIGISST